MKFKRTVLLLTVVIMMGLLLGASTAQAFEVEIDDTGTNATAIRNLEFNGVLYDVTFREASIKDIWGDEAFDFDQPNVAGDASVAVNDALNTEPDVVTVANSSGTEYYIPYARAGIFVEVFTNIYSGGWNSTGSFLNTAVQATYYAKFTQVESIAPAPVPKTGQTESVLPGDDGDLQMGVTWPDPRFTDNDDGTVKDNLTGLIWLRNAACLALDTLPWSSAVEASNNLADGQCGLVDGSSPGDWRLPNIKELLSLIDYGNADPALPTGHPFTRVQAGWYWTGTTISTDVELDAVWIVSVYYGVVQAFFTASGAEVWPVRGGNDGLTPNPPGKATLISPSGTITDNTPTYTWNAVKNATRYRLWVNDSTAENVIDQSYTADSANCGDGTGECAVTPETVLADDTFEWWIQAQNDSGAGPWSDDGMFFTVDTSSE